MFYFVIPLFCGRADALGAFAKENIHDYEDFICFTGL